MRPENPPLATRAEWSLNILSKVMALDDAVARVQPGQSVSFGGFNLQNKPMAAARQLIRQGTSDLSVICAAPSSLDVDLLVGAGMVRELLTQSVSAEDFAAIAPCFRRACEEGVLTVVDVDQGVVNAGLRAAKMGLDSIAALAAIGTSSIEHGGTWLRNGIEPFTGREIVYVRQLRPDYAFVHVSVADTQGRGLQIGSVFNDALLCGAASQVIVTAERVVEPDELREMRGTAVSWRDNTVAVVSAPHGAHPTAAGGSYSYDAAAIEQYCESVRRVDGFADYQKRVIGASEESYQRQTGLIGR